MIFWTIIAIITLILCLIGFYPLFKKPQQLVANQRDKLNKAFYIARLQEVEKEANEGIIENSEQTKFELQQSLLEDIPEQAEVPPASKNSFPKIWFLPFVFVIGAVSVCTYLAVGSWQATSMVEMTHKKLEYFYERIKDEESNPLSEAELNQFAVALRADLQENPTNAKGWFMLGQVGMAKDDGQLAYESYAKALQLEPQNLQYKSTYAQLLMLSQDKSDKERGKALLKELIREDHTNLDALSMLAFNAFEEADYKMAAMTWGMMLKLIPEDNPRRKTVEKSIDMAIQMMKEQEKSAVSE